MIVELKKNKKFVRFVWLDGSGVVTVQNWDLSIQPRNIKNVNEDIYVARQIWRNLVKKGYERVRFPNLLSVRGGTETDHESII